MILEPDLIAMLQSEPNEPGEIHMVDGGDYLRVRFFNGRVQVRRFEDDGTGVPGWFNMRPDDAARLGVALIRAAGEA